MNRQQQKIPGVLWIAWERHRRTVELCRHFGIELMALTSKRSRLFKHPFFAAKTFLELLRRKPKVLVVQNPSIILTLLACILKKTARYRLIVDSHNGGLLPENRLLKKLGFLYRYFQKRADVTVVTNDGLAGMVARNGGAPFVLPDKVPDINLPDGTVELAGKYNVVAICTFGADEPYEQVMDVASRFSEDVAFYVTGNHEKIAHTVREKPKNLIFTGFLPEQEYWKLLKAANLIIDLTTRDDCLVCGAYEAVAMEVPAVLTDTHALRGYFSKGTVFTDNSAQDLEKQISHAFLNLHVLQEEIRCLKSELSVRWSQRADEFMAFLAPDTE